VTPSVEVAAALLLEIPPATATKTPFPKVTDHQESELGSARAVQGYPAARGIGDEVGAQPYNTIANRTTGMMERSGFTTAFLLGGTSPNIRKCCGISH
jgi:hypothetical protein